MKTLSLQDLNQLHCQSCKIRNVHHKSENEKIKNKKNQKKYFIFEKNNFQKSFFGLPMTLT